MVEKVEDHEEMAIKDLILAFFLSSSLINCSPGY